MIQKSIPLDFVAVHELSHAITVYLARLQAGTMNREQWYAAYILKQFHVKLMASGNRMYANQKGYTTVKVDGVQAMALVDVLTAYRFTPYLNQFLGEVAKIQQRWE